MTTVAACPVCMELFETMVDVDPHGGWTIPAHSRCAPVVIAATVGTRCAGSGALVTDRLLILAGSMHRADPAAPVAKLALPLVKYAARVRTLQRQDQILAVLHAAAGPLSTEEVAVAARVTLVDGPRVRYGPLAGRRADDFGQSAYRTLRQLEDRGLVERGLPPEGRDPRRAWWDATLDLHESFVPVEMMPPLRVVQP